MKITYREATIEDLDFLVESRLDFIKISEVDDNYEDLKSNLYVYFEKGLREMQCNIVLAEVNSSVIGTGIIFYYNSVPSIFNPWGKNAYITSMFVNEKYRRQGVATTILDKLIKIAMIKGYHIFILQESEMESPFMRNMDFMKVNKE